MALRDDVVALLRSEFPMFMKPAAERIADAIIPLVRAAERERCAGRLEQRAVGFRTNGVNLAKSRAYDHAAGDLRALEDE